MPMLWEKGVLTCLGISLRYAKLVRNVIIIEGGDLQDFKNKNKLN